MIPVKPQCGVVRPEGVVTIRVGAATGLRWGNSNSTQEREVVDPIQLESSWITAGLQLDYSWITAGLQLDYSWILQLDYSWITAGLQLAETIRSLSVIRLEPAGIQLAL